jgi:hypothetical protein
MVVDPSSVNRETELKRPIRVDHTNFFKWLLKLIHSHMRVQQVVNDTDPLMWWNQHQSEFPHLVLGGRITNQSSHTLSLESSPARVPSRLVYTGLNVGLKHLKKETRLINERFESVMGECVI